MKRRRLLIGALLVVMIGAGVVILSPGPPEPVYQGKSLGRWLRETLDLKFTLVSVPTNKGYYFRANAISYTATNSISIDELRSVGGSIMIGWDLDSWVPAEIGPGQTPQHSVTVRRFNVGGIDIISPLSYPSSPRTGLIRVTMPQLLSVDSNAVPCLLEAVKTRDAPLHNTYASIWPKLPQWVRNRLNPPVEARLIRRNAAILLGDIGRKEREAKSAGERTNFQNVVIVKAVLEAKNDPDKFVRVIADQALWWSHPEVAAKGTLK